MTYSQDSRIGKLTTELKDDELVLLEFSGVEGVNEVGMFRLRALSTNPGIDFDLLLGKKMLVEFIQLDNTIRVFHLIATGARQLGKDPAGFIYEFELQPWVWFMSKRVNSRIFHNLKVNEIIEKVLVDYNFLDGASHKFNVQANLPKLEYTVQFQETDLDFVRRMMEQYGLNFHIEMSLGGQKMVIYDNNDNLQDKGNIPFKPVKGQNVSGLEHFSSWVAQRAVTSGKVRLQDYDFKFPSTNLEKEQEKKAPYKNSKLEIYEFPGKFNKDDGAETLKKRRMDAHEADDSTVAAIGDVLSLAAGNTFSLTEHEGGQDGKYVVTRIEHHFTEGGYRSGGRSTQEVYTASLKLAKHDAPLAPKMDTPRCRVFGVMTGTVVAGKNGGGPDIDCDKYGRILVKFPWDYKGEQSMRCRVSQMWAGNGWGHMFIPRIGMEVLVEFLNGDPDHPVVTGCVYNAENMPPYALPDNKTKSGMKSKSSPSGGFNQLTFEDKDGEEMIEIHGQKDLKVTILNNEDHEIRNDSTRKILGNRTDTIEKDQTSTVTKNQTLTVKQNQTTTVTQNRTVTTKGEEKKSVTKALSISSDTKIELKVGGSSITIDNMSIKITAPKVEVLASAELSTNGGVAAKHTSGGILDVKAPLVKINS